MYPLVGKPLTSLGSKRSVLAGCWNYEASSEAVGVLILPASLKDQYLQRWGIELASKQQQIASKTASLKRVSDLLVANNSTTLDLHEQNENLQARISASYKEKSYLTGQKETLEQDLGTIQEEVEVNQTIFRLIELTDPSKNPRLPFQTIPLPEVAARLGTPTWSHIDKQSFNANHRAIMLCNELGLPGNAAFVALWNAPNNPQLWRRFFGSMPQIRTGRNVSAGELKLRLAGYVGITPPTEEIDLVLEDLAADNDSLSGISEGDEEDEGEESGNEEGEAPVPKALTCLPKSVHVPSWRTPRKKTS